MIDVSNLRIYELRDYARLIGVKAPTTKVRAQLIAEINLISCGELKPFENVSSKGRKPATSFVLEEKTKEFLNHELKTLKHDVCEKIDALYNKINLQ